VLQVSIKYVTNFSLFTSFIYCPSKILSLITWNVFILLLCHHFFPSFFFQIENFSQERELLVHHIFLKRGSTITFPYVSTNYDMTCWHRQCQASTCVIVMITHHPVQTLLQFYGIHWLHEILLQFRHFFWPACKLVISSLFFWKSWSHGQDWGLRNSEAASLTFFRNASKFADVG
jgi:hypothetical protein